MRMLASLFCGSLLIIAAATGLHASVVETALPHYRPQPVEFPKNTGYITPEGAIAIIGYNDMQGILEALDKLFIAAHPEFKFSLVLKGTKTAAAALTSGASAFAPMGAEFFDADIAAYRKVAGADPVMFKIAHDSLNPQALSAPLGIFVNKSNPLEALTADQVARIFTTGSARGDFANWGQLGLSGEWAQRPIHPCGLAADTAIGFFMQRYKFSGRPYTANYVSLVQSTDVAKRVGEDPQAIGFGSIFRATLDVKVLAIGTGDGASPMRGTTGDILSGKYPYDRHLLIYARQPLDPWLREYLRLVFSREGQEAIATEPLGYLPLNANEVAEELAKLDR